MYISVARVYRNACAGLSNDIIEHKSVNIRLSSPTNYIIHKFIGKGRYSLVFRGSHSSGDPVIIKVLKPIQAQKINRELSMLTSLSHPGIIKLLDVCRPQSLIFEYTPFISTREFLKNCTLPDLKDIMYQLLSALDYVHSRGIMHRDIKPQNLVVGLDVTLKIIDWGLAEFYIPKRKYHTRVGTKSYKAIELLVGYGYYDYGVDIWASGMVLIEGIANLSRPLLSGSDDAEMLAGVLGFFGTQNFTEFVKKYEIRSNVREKRVKKLEVRGIEHKHGMDLFKKMCVFDHENRLTAREALMHPFLN